MRKVVINKLMHYITSKKKMTQDEKDITKYGLETIYILITKLTFIFILAWILHIFKEMITFLFIFNIIRTFACGLHATKSYICLIVSTICFIGIPYVALLLIIPNWIKIIVGTITTLLIFKYSPADTHKKPIVNMKKRATLKRRATMVSILFVILSLFTKNFISNCLIFSLILEVIFIAPLTYKIFKLPYNNYIKYLKKEGVTCS